MLTLCFTRSDTWPSRAIRWFTRAQVSHSLIGFEFEGAQFFLHASVGGVQVSPRAKFLAKNTLVAEYEIVPDVSVGFRAALARLNEHYDYLSIVGWGAVILLWRWLKVRAHNPWQSPTAMVCTELVLQLDMEAGKPGARVPEWQGLDPEATSPQELLDLMAVKLGSFKEVRHGG